MTTSFIFCLTITSLVATWPKIGSAYSSILHKRKMAEPLLSFTELERLRSVLDSDNRADMFERQVSDVEQQIFDLTNEARSRGHRCGSTWYPPTTPLTMDDKLNTAAGEHARDMVAQNYFEHRGKDGRTADRRMEDAGYVGCSTGENIGCDDTVESVIKGWLESPGHCENMMSGDFKDLGVGYARGGSCGGMWVQNFGRGC